MKCRYCTTELEADAPIYRIQRFNGDYGTTCGCHACATKHDGDSEYAQNRWGPPVPCTNCGRPVIRKKQQQHLHPVCSDACYAAVRNAAARKKRAAERQRVACKACGETFTPKRTDAAFCSVACKQRAYRTRQRA